MIVWMIFFSFFTMHAAQEFAAQEFAVPKIPEQATSAKEPVCIADRLKGCMNLGYDPTYKSNGEPSYFHIRTQEEIVAATKMLNEGYLPLTFKAKHAIAQALTQEFTTQKAAQECLQRFQADHAIHQLSIDKILEHLAIKYDALEYQQQCQDARVPRSSPSKRRQRSQSFHGSLPDLSAGHDGYEDTFVQDMDAILGFSDFEIADVARPDDF